MTSFHRHRPFATITSESLQGRRSVQRGRKPPRANASGHGANHNLGNKTAGFQILRLPQRHHLGWLRWPEWLQRDSENRRASIFPI
ncbi:hypothetical protein E2320_004022 [Naja naja]|nr:hypothetical protein E2320_004022 [Naja naja]